MSMDKEIRWTLSGPITPSGGVGSRSMRGRWQWPLTVAVGEPCQLVPQGLRSAVGIVDGGRDGVVDDPPIAQSTVEGQWSGKRRKICRRMVEE